MKLFKILKFKWLSEKNFKLSLKEEKNDSRKMHQETLLNKHIIFKVKIIKQILKVL